MEKDTRGEAHFRNKRRNRGRIGSSKSDVNDKKSLPRRRRLAHHSRRQVLAEGIAAGAQEDWLPKTSAFGGDNRFYCDVYFGSFRRWRYRLCDLTARPSKTQEERAFILAVLEKYPDEIGKLTCRRCRHYYQMVQKLPEILNRDDVLAVKELYRTRDK